MPLLSFHRRQELLLQSPFLHNPSQSPSRHSWQFKSFILIAATLAVLVGVTQFPSPGRSQTTLIQISSSFNKSELALSQEKCAPSGEPILEPRKVSGMILPSKAYLETSESHVAQWWFKIYTPFRWLIRQSGVGRFNSLLDRFGTATAPPPSLPVFSQGTNPSDAEILKLSDRTLFWVPILGSKVVMMPLSNKFWHKLLIESHGHDENNKLLAPQWPKNMLVPIFIMYHLSHNLFLYGIVDLAVQYGYLSDKTGLDWELWNWWVNWILLVLNVTAVTKYMYCRGSNLSDSTNDVLLLLMPGVGSDAHVAKDWAFIGVCIRTAQCQQSVFWTVFAYAVGYLSIAANYIPLMVLSKTGSDWSAVESFIASHWPIIMATDAVEDVEDDTDDEDDANQTIGDVTGGDNHGEPMPVSEGVNLKLPKCCARHCKTRCPKFHEQLNKILERCGSGAQFCLLTFQDGVAVVTQRFCQSKQEREKWFIRVIPQTTEAKALVAFYNELPQAALELGFGLVFGFEPFIVFVIILSLIKAFGIPALKKLIVEWIQFSGSVKALLAFVKAHGDGKHFRGLLALDSAVRSRNLKRAIPSLLWMQAKTEETVPSESYPFCVKVLMSYSTMVLERMSGHYAHTGSGTGFGKLVMLAQLARQDITANGIPDALAAIREVFQTVSARDVRRFLRYFESDGQLSLGSLMCLESANRVRGDLLRETLAGVHKTCALFDLELLQQLTAAFPLVPEDTRLSLPLTLRLEALSRVLQPMERVPSDVLKQICKISQGNFQHLHDVFGREDASALDVGALMHFGAAARSKKKQREIAKRFGHQVIQKLREAIAGDRELEECFNALP